MRLLIIALVAVGLWTLSALVAWCVIHVGARHDPPEWDDDDGVQPSDPYTWGMMETGTTPTTIRWTSGGAQDWRN